MRHRRRIALAWIAVLAALAISASPAAAGPPFLTDDPECVPLHHTEFFIFGTNDAAPISETTQGPGAEYNYGFATNAYVHVSLAYASVEAQDVRLSGVGDAEFGVKLRFLTETPRRPMVAFYPMAELATARRGLGNGVTWYKLPIWLEKNAGPWTVFGGGGIALNPAAGQWNYGFGGIAAERDIGAHLTLGVETYVQGPSDAVTPATSYGNAGAIWKPSEHLNVLLSIGHSYTGVNHTIGYGAIYWTWGSAARRTGLGAENAFSGSRNL